MDTSGRMEEAGPLQAQGKGMHSAWHYYYDASLWVALVHAVQRGLPDRAANAVDSLFAKGYAVQTCCAPK